MTLEIFINTTRTSNLSGGRPCIGLAYVSDDDYGAIRRMARHRGFECVRVRRKASEEEAQIEGHPHRVGFLTYYSWHSLIEDERKWDDSEEWMAQLSELRTKYPQFESNQLTIQENQQ